MRRHSKFRQSTTCSPCTWVPPVNTPGSGGHQFLHRDCGLLVTTRRKRRYHTVVPPAAPHGRLLGVGSAEQRHAAAPWTAWQSVIPTLREITEYQDTDYLFAATPIRCSQLLRLKSTPAQQMNSPPSSSNLWVRPVAPMAPTTPFNTPCTNSLLTASLTTPSGRPSSSLKRPGMLAPTSSCPTAKHTKRTTGAFRGHESAMLARPAASDPTNISPTGPNASAAKRTCSCPTDAHQLHCIVCKSGGGVDQQHSARARCSDDLVTTQTTRPPTRAPAPHNPKGHGRMSCSTCAATRITLTRRWSRRFLPTLD